MGKLRNEAFAHRSKPEVPYFRFQLHVTQVGNFISELGKLNVLKIEQVHRFHVQLRTAVKEGTISKEGSEWNDTAEDSQLEYDRSKLLDPAATKNASQKADIPGVLLFERGIPKWLAQYVSGEYSLMQVRLSPAEWAYCNVVVNVFVRLLFVCQEMVNGRHAWCRADRNDLVCLFW